MTAPGLRLFDTPIGRCGVAWSDRGVLAVQLPEPRDIETRARILARFPEARDAVAPAYIQEAINAMVQSVRGQATDLKSIPLVMDDLPLFHRRVTEVVRDIPRGETLAYGDVAYLAGAPRAARAVGHALKQNPFAIVVPCHRVIAADGTIGGYSANGGISVKAHLLALEGAHVKGA